MIGCVFFYVLEVRTIICYKTVVLLVNNNYYYIINLGDIHKEVQWKWTHPPLLPPTHSSSEPVYTNLDHQPQCTDGSKDDTCKTKRDVPSSISGSGLQSPTNEIKTETVNDQHTWNRWEIWRDRSQRSKYFLWPILLGMDRPDGWSNRPSSFYYYPCVSLMTFYQYVYVWVLYCTPTLHPRVDLCDIKTDLISFIDYYKRQFFFSHKSYTTV